MWWARTGHQVDGFHVSVIPALKEGGEKRMNTKENRRTHSTVFGTANYFQKKTSFLCQRRVSRVEVSTCGIFQQDRPSAATQPGAPARSPYTSLAPGSPCRSWATAWGRHPQGAGDAGDAGKRTRTPPPPTRRKG